MPELRPFAGIRYSSQGEISELVCPPYDVISPDEQQRLHARHPHNAVRLELAEPRGTDNKYAHVGETFSTWLDDGILEREGSDSYYVYRQDFEFEGERKRVVGVIGALELEEFGTDSGVLPHERTMPGPKEDRLALMRACPANISPIYAIYRGAGALHSFYGSLEERAPQARFESDGILHRLWVVSAAAEIELIRSALRPGPLVIADGHHRYETALAFHRERGGAPGGAPGEHDAIMCFCVDGDSEQLVVLPYNRVLKTSSDLARHLADELGAEPLAGDPAAALAAPTPDHPFVALLPEQTLFFTVSDAEVVARTGERHAAWRRLDVVALHEVVFASIGESAIEELAFTKDADEIRRRVAEGWSAGFLLRPLDAPQIVDVATSGERMPQKASYFWPKALTGLVFHPLD